MLGREGTSASVGAGAAPQRLCGADTGAKLAKHEWDFADRLRLAEQVALDLRAAFRPQDFELLLGLDALGRSDHAKARAQPGDCADDRDAIVFLAELADEGAVDLD